MVESVSADTLDDLEAVRSVVEALGKFPKEDQQRILRWSQERLGLAASTATPAAPQAERKRKHPAPPPAPGAVLDIKAFIEKKKPVSNVHFAAAVAYYHKFEAPPRARKKSITAADLQNACQKLGRDRMKRPNQSLINARLLGLLDRVNRGAYTLNAVGEELVAVRLPPPLGRRRQSGLRSASANAKPS